MKKIKLIISFAFLLVGCSSYAPKNGELTHIQLIDKNGVNETISQKERLALYQKVDFLKAQPYQKVVLVFKRDPEGKARSKLTTYHDNGMIFQYLEVLQGRANGSYKEWYENGNLRIEANVIEGIGDLSKDAQTSFVFDQKSSVWNVDGSLLAEIFYQKGKLEGESIYYYPNGKIAKTVFYVNDLIEGEKKVYDKEGNCVGKTRYLKGEKEGESYFLGDKNCPKREEVFSTSCLISGKYYDFDGNLTHEIVDGAGVVPFYENGVLSSEFTYVNGMQEGRVKTYFKSGALESVYYLVEGQKQGEEIHYYEPKNKEDRITPLIQIHWRDDEVHGVVRTWYRNGKIESEKEMVFNKKQGPFMAFYNDGSLMMIEEYDNDILQSGKYFKKGDEIPSSRVISGAGFAMIYDENGNFLKKIEYQKGIPIE